MGSTSGVKGHYSQIDSFVLNSFVKNRFREVRWTVDTSGGDPDTLIGSYKVIADSSADYYSLWYLLPMVLLFILLTIRKLKARDPSVGTTS